jgi:acylphosphatase
MTSAATAVLVRLRGRVQGVGFRAFVVDRAQELALRGWVRNKRDGSVEVLIAGPPAAIETMLGLLARGPRPALVERIDVEPAEINPKSAGFWQLATE